MTSEKVCDNIDCTDKVKICLECKGDVHDHFGDEDSDMNYWTWAHCHKCNQRFNSDDFQELEKQERIIVLVFTKID